MNEELQMKYYVTVQELNRIDHMIFVTLKYTRTVDVLKSIVQRMIGAFDFMLDLILEYHRQKGEIENFQKSPGLKCDQIRELTEDETIKDILTMYLLLRRLTRSEYDTINEYKRHVGMVIETPDSSKITVNIDLVTEYYHKMKDYLEHVHGIVDAEAE